MKNTSLTWFYSQNELVRNNSSKQTILLTIYLLCSTMTMHKKGNKILDYVYTICGSSETIRTSAIAGSSILNCLKHNNVLVIAYSEC